MLKFSKTLAKYLKFEWIEIPFNVNGFFLRIVVSPKTRRVIAIMTSLSRTVHFVTSSRYAGDNTYFQGQLDHVYCRLTNWTKHPSYTMYTALLCITLCYILRCDYDWFCNCTAPHRTVPYRTVRERNVLFSVIYGTISYSTILPFANLFFAVRCYAMLCNATPLHPRYICSV